MNTQHLWPFAFVILAGCSDGGSGPTMPLSPLTTPPERAALPPWLTYCDEGPCNLVEPVVATVCCAPIRSTIIMPQADGIPISGVSLPIWTTASVTVDHGNGQAFATVPPLVEVYRASSLHLFSDLDLTVSWYHDQPVWGDVTHIPFVSDTRHTPHVTLHWWKHRAFSEDWAPLSAQLPHIIQSERELTGMHNPEHADLFLLPTELAAAQPFGEGNFSFGDGVVTINYGNPPDLAARGGLEAVVTPLVAHEYVHELYYAVERAWFPNSDLDCWREGLANAVGHVAGFIPSDVLGPIGLRGADFRQGCANATEDHDRGDCFFWHLDQAGGLTRSFVFHLFHPRTRLTFQSCAFTAHTGNALFVSWTDAGAEAGPVLDAIGLPHAASYADARKALGL